MSRPVRLAVMGVGLIGRRHLEIASREPACQVVAAADPDPSAQAAAQSHGARYYAHYRALLEAEPIDGVIVATPNSTHAEVAIACVERGLPVLVEKPVTDTMAAGEALASAAEAAGAPVAVGHHRRFDSAVEKARALLDDGRIGRLTAVQCTWSMRKHDSYFEAAWRTERPGGGPVLINLIHDVDLLRHLCGDIVRVYAELGAQARGKGVEDTAAVSLRFASGALGTITASDASPSPWAWEAGTGDNPDIPVSARNCYRFLGTEGALGFPRLEVWRHDASVEPSWREPMHMEATEAPPRAALPKQLAHFCSVVRGETQPRVSGRDGLATLAATTAILESARTARAVELGPPS